MPHLQAIVSTDGPGRATPRAHYAAAALALAGCCKREDILRCRREGPGQTLPSHLATSRREQAARAVASAADGGPGHESPGYAVLEMLSSCTPPSPRSGLANPHNRLGFTLAAVAAAVVAGPGRCVKHHWHRDSCRWHCDRP